MDAQSIVSYLADLRDNNNKPWFEANRERYDALRADFTEEVGKILAAVGDFDSAVAGIIPADCLFRIYRDVRFSKDKSPYKTTFSAMFTGGRKGPAHAGYYVQIDADGACLVGCGLHEPEPPILQKVRAAIAEDGAPLTAIISDAKFRETFGGLNGEQLKKVPREFPADHPMGDYLRMKSYTVMREEPIGVLGDTPFAPHVAGLFEVAYPLVRYLRSVVR